jgi:hypothetical protein
LVGLRSWMEATCTWHRAPSGLVFSGLVHEHLRGRGRRRAHGATRALCVGRSHHLGPSALYLTHPVD